MRFYLNEVSIQGQFEDVDGFLKLLQRLLAVRKRSPLLTAMQVTVMLADRPVSHSQTVRQAIQAWRGSDLLGIFLEWIGKRGPFIEEERLEEEQDLFTCLDIELLKLLDDYMADRDEKGAAASSWEETVASARRRFLNLGSKAKGDIQRAFSGRAGKLRARISKQSRQIQETANFP